MDADGLLIARLVLIVDFDEVSGLEHLRCGLSKARFIAIQRRQGEDARQACDHGDQCRQQGAARTARPTIQKGVYHGVKIAPKIASVLVLHRPTALGHRNRL
jgi:hypothetical protein